MPAVTPTQTISLARKFARFSGTLLSLSLALLLALQLFFWLCLRNDWRLVLPEFATRFVVNRLAESGVELHCGKIYFRPNGALEAEDIEIGAPGGGSPNFTIRAAAATVNFPWLLRGQLILKRALVEGGVFYCPAAVAPDGRRQVVLDEVRAVLDRENDGWMRVRTLQSRFGEMPVVLHGEFLPPSLRQKSAAQIVVTPEKWRAINNIAVQMLEIRPRLETLGKLSLEVTGQGDDSGAVIFSLNMYGNDFTAPFLQGARASGVRFSGMARFDGEIFHPVGEPELFAESLSWTGDVSANSVMPDDAADVVAAVSGAVSSSAPVVPRVVSVKTGAVRISGRPGPRWRPPPGIHFSACDVVVDAERVDYLDGDVRWSGFPFVEVRASVVSGADSVETRVRGNVLRRSLDAAFTARVTPAVYLGRPDVRALLPSRLSSLAFHQSVELAGMARFGSNLRFKDLNFSFDTGAVEYADFKLVSGKGRVRLTPKGIEVTDADLCAANYRAMGGFRTGFGAEEEFRFLLKGSTNPNYLGPFIGKFWVELWEQFKLREDLLPHADIEIRGNWGVHSEFIYCVAAGDDLTFRSAHFDKAEVRIWETPQRIALYGMSAWQGGQSATGTFQLHYTPLPEHKRHSFRFHFEGNFPKETSAALGGPRLNELLKPVTAEKPVDTVVTGYVHSWASATPEREQVLVCAKAPGNLTAWNLDFSNFDGSVAYDTGLVVVTVEDAAFAIGRIGKNPAPWSSVRPNDRPQRAWLDLRPAKPTLFLDVELLSARRTALLANLKNLGKLKGGTEEVVVANAPETLAVPVAPEVDSRPPEAPDVPSVGPDNSSLDIIFTGGLTLPELETLTGSGSARLWDPALPSFHLFGGLSRLLEKMSISASTIKINRAQSDFSIRNKTVYFPNIKITGENAQIDCVGNYEISDEKLDFRALLTTKIAEDIPGVKQIIGILSKWTQWVPIDIKGTLDKPQWSINPSPPAIFWNPLEGKK